MIVLVEDTNNHYIFEEYRPGTKRLDLIVPMNTLCSEAAAVLVFSLGFLLFWAEETLIEHALLTFLPFVDHGLLAKARSFELLLLGVYNASTCPTRLLLNAFFLIEKS